MLQTKYYLSRALSCALVLMVAWGCSAAATDIDTTFDMPTGLTVAGTTGQRLFIANSGEAALQVIELGEDLAALDPVEGPSFYFPLRIPGGPAPEEIASTEDGRFVVVLNWVTNKLHVIDADTLDNAFVDGIEVEIDLSDERNPYRILSVPGGCERSSIENCSGHLLISYPESGKIAEWVIQDTAGGPVVELAGNYEVDGAPGEISTDLGGSFIFAADTKTPHIHRVGLGTDTLAKWEIGQLASTLSVSTNGRFLVVGRKGIQDALVMEGVSGETPSIQDADAFYAPGTQCLADCSGELSVEQQCPGAHPADLALCKGETGIETSPAGAYQGIYLGFIPAAITPLGAGAGHPAVAVPCQSIADEPLEQIWSEVVMVQGQNGQGSFIGLALESGEDISPTLLSEGWCRGASLVDEAEEAYLLEQEDPTVDSVEPLYFTDVFSACGALPERNRFDCVATDDGQAGVVLNPARTRNTLIGYEWEPVVTLPSTGQKFARDITGGIYKEENGVAIFADAGVSIGAFAPYFRTEKQLIESGQCTDNSNNCGDILEITSDLSVTIAAADPNLAGEPTGSVATVPEECLAALADEPAERCSLERRIIDTRSIDGATELILDRPLPEVCLPDAGRITYRVRMADTYGVTITGTSTQRLGPGQTMGLGGAVWPTGAVQASVRPFDGDVRDYGACERYGDEGIFQGTAYRRDASGLVRLSDAHAEVLSNGNTVGLTWSLLQTTSGEALSVAGAPMLLGRSVMWQPETGLPVIFTSYARSNRIVGLVPYPYTADPDDEFDADAPFLSNNWRDAPTHFTELN